LVWCDASQSVIVTRLSEAGRLEHCQWDHHNGRPLTLTFVRDLLGRFVYKCHPSRGTWVSFFDAQRGDAEGAPGPFRGPGRASPVPGSLRDSPA
jgi:hypothetical protein